MNKTTTLGLLGTALLAVSALAQSPKQVVIDHQDSQRSREEFVRTLEQYPPSLRGVLSLDPTLLSNKDYLATYPDLASYITSHPDVARNPAFYIGTIGREFQVNNERHDRDRWDRLLESLAIFSGFGMAIGLLTWLIRTLVDYRRWTRLATVQTNVHTKLLDRFTQNEDLLAYIQSPPGAKFLESSPITLDPGQRAMGAPLGRILWSLQAGLVVAAAGVGMQFAASRMADGDGEPLHVLGILGIAIGIGLVASAGVSYVISQRMGLFPNRNEPPSMTGSGMQG
jgi:hypothetical protein